MRTEAPVNFQGDLYQVNNAYCKPRPDVVPPIMVGGAGEKFMLRIVAQYADWGNYIYLPSIFVRKNYENLTIYH